MIVVASIASTMTALMPVNAIAFRAERSLFNANPPTLLDIAAGGGRSAMLGPREHARKGYAHDSLAYWSALCSAASMAEARSAAARPRGSLPLGQYSSLCTCSSA